MDVLSWWPAVSAGLVVLLQLALALRILMRRQPLANTHAWLLLVLFLPVAGAGLYVLIGENRLGSRRLRRFEQAAAEVEPYATRLWKHREHRWGDDEKRFWHLARLGNNMCNAPALIGNDLQLLASAGATLDAMIVDIDGAESYCHLLTYIFQPTGKAVEVAEALMGVAGRGVECRLAVDSAGSHAFLESELAAKLRENGVEILEMLPVSFFRLLFARIDLRNHRKMCIVDGKIAYCGSQNVTDESFGPPGRGGVGSWMDATVRLEGPAAQGLSLLFISDWNSEAKARISDLDRYFPPVVDVGEQQSERASAVQLLPSGPGLRPRAIQTMFTTTMYAAREEIIMTTPYFVPDPTTLAALMSAASRGVEVTLVLPKRNNKRLVAAASQSSYEDLLEAGVRIMHYGAGLLHAKTVTVDRDIALIGSANLDQRSFWINFEITLAVYDTDFASHLRLLQKQYMGDSDQVNLAEWKRRGVVRRAIENAAQLFSPLL